MHSATEKVAFFDQRMKSFAWLKRQCASLASVSGDGDDAAAPQVYFCGWSVDSRDVGMAFAPLTR
jgi:hypothetical protein